MKKVWIPRILLSEMTDEIERYAPLETGGSFFGYHSDDNDIVITHRIEAGPFAKRTIRSFEPDQTYQLRTMEKLFYESGKSLSYLGDWHSHPSSSAQLSLRDRRTLGKIAKSPDAKCPQPIMMVFGLYPKKWDINCVQFKDKKQYFFVFSSCEYEILEIITY